MTKKSMGNGVQSLPTARKGIYFLSLTVEDTRCFGLAQTLDLSDGEGRPARWTILLGNNGTGKTTLLRMLTGFDDVERTSFDGRVVSILRAFSFRREMATSLNFLRTGALKARCQARLAVGFLFVPLESANGVVSSVITYDAEGALQQITTPHWAVTGTREERADSKIYAYGASRRLGAASLAEKTDDDIVGSLFTDRFELRNAEEWLLRLDYSASKPSKIQEQQKARLAQVCRLLVDLLPEVEKIRFTSPEAANPTPRAEFKTPDGWVPLSGLGYGYQSLIAWVLDLASRMVERHPDSPNPLAEPAVVLVDEIDLHLHPTWQRTLIGFLTERFPNTQFIATAHSPLVAQAAEGANLAVLRREGDHVVIDNDVDSIRGWRVDQILTSDLFGLATARPPQYDAIVQRRAALASKAKLSKDEKAELKRLDEQVGDLPAGETATMAKELKAIQETLKLLAEREKATK